MYRKILSACTVFFMSLNIANAYVSAPYVGAEIGGDSGNWKIRDVTNVYTNASERGAYGGVFAGWGWDATQNFYLAAEAFGNESSARTNTHTINTATVPASIRMS